MNQNRIAKFIETEQTYITGTMKRIPFPNPLPRTAKFSKPFENLKFSNKNSDS